MDTMTHIERFENAVACKPVDRTSYINFDGGLLGRYGNPEFQPCDLYARQAYGYGRLKRARQSEPIEADR